MKNRPSDRPGAQPGKAPGPAGRDLTDDERAQAAGTGDAAVTGDTRVAGPAPKSDVATAFPNPRDTAEPAPKPEPGPAAAPVAPPGTGAKPEAGAEPEAATKPGPVPVPEAGKPGETASEERIERLMDAKDADRFHARWRDLQSAFVDDPTDAVRKADELTTEVVEAIKTSVAERKRSLDERWRTEKDAPADTERHRLALRAYRDLLERLLSA
ncbi:hypothetical protein [Actinomadura rudentiformis]|uniref:Uncharacterized protein n=1 Tax=Actinomadura rudentiformis TaxID=359158 RepID=A0A6H9ZAA5_9ACTN|nr:hypothetical protein [Actinomadura rudentiformis]KAB2352625.1 hypothetical protein F8566_02960 [Actinomadura rudentiformis]